MRCGKVNLAKISVVDLLIMLSRAVFIESPQRLLLFPGVVCLTRRKRRGMVGKSILSLRKHRKKSWDRLFLAQLDW